ncbi:transcriptional regulator [Candidatus Dependentiae bacterium]|nr:transcriptional regulator [Candidatus Dependentiae bacterium]
MESDHHSDINLYEALLMLKNAEECERFFADLCTPQEIKALKERWRVCQLLNRGDLSYREIQAISKASLVTITRVARFLKDEPYLGYKTILDRIKLRKASCKKVKSSSQPPPQ